MIQGMGGQPDPASGADGAIFADLGTGELTPGTDVRIIPDPGVVDLGKKVNFRFLRNTGTEIDKSSENDPFVKNIQNKADNILKDEIHIVRPLQFSFTT